MPTFWYVPIGLHRLRLCLKFQASNSSQALSRDVYVSNLVQNWPKMFGKLAFLDLKMMGGKKKLIAKWSRRHKST